jgi:hypothetical protein
LAQFPGEYPCKPKAILRKLEAFGGSPEEDCNRTISEPLWQKEQRCLLTESRPEGLGASPTALRQTRTHSSQMQARSNAGGEDINLAT